MSSVKPRLTVFTPFLKDLGTGVSTFNLLSAGLVMGVMLIPTVASISEDAMAAVPQDLRDGAYGLGASRLQVSTRVVVPAPPGSVPRHLAPQAGQGIRRGTEPGGAVPPPFVFFALTRLADEGRLRRSGRHWVLAGDPPPVDRRLSRAAVDS